MNLEKATILSDIAKYIRPVGDCDKSNGSWHADKNVPGCLICNAVRGGFFSKEYAERNDLDFKEGFSRHFNVTLKEAKDVIYHDHIEPSSSTTSANYYQVCKELLTKYGYAHLLNDKQVVHEGSGRTFNQLMDDIEAGTLEAVE